MFPNTFFGKDATSFARPIFSNNQSNLFPQPTVTITLQTNLSLPRSRPNNICQEGSPELEELKISPFNLRFNLTASQLQFLTFWLVLYGCQLSIKSQSWRAMWSRIGYGIVLLSLWRGNSATAQNITPLPPDRPEPPQPQPLPPRQNPWDGTLEAPPLPESVTDIPGTIVVERFKFAGNTVFSEAELNRAIGQYTERPVSFAQLIEAANAITNLYTDRGYITSGAYLPAQNLESGVVQIQIVEGTLAEIDVNITGGRLNESYIRDRLTADIDTPLNINQLQSALQLLQLNPLIENLNAELSTGVEPGTNFLTVSATGADTFQVDARLNNNRNLSVGTFERGIGIEEANLSGIGDRFSAAYYNTDGSNQYEASYTLPVNTSNGSLRFDFRLAQNQIVQSPFEDIDLEIRSRNYDLTWRQPILRKATSEQSQELALSITASRRESDAAIFNVPQRVSPGATEDGEIRTSILSFSQEWLQRDRQQVISARSQFSIGLDVLDATSLEEEPNSQFFSWRGQLFYLRSLGNPTDISQISPTVLLSSQLQLSADPLISTEQFSLGGINTVRGYRQDALLTDNGFSIAAELRLPIARISQFDATLQLTPFIDFGTGWNTDDEETEFDTLIGTGVGLLLQTPQSLSARLYWGIPLINSDTDSDDTLQENGVHLQLEYSFF